MPRSQPRPPVARYQAVKDHIRRRIQEGSWKAGDRVASESELVTALGVSRMTVNRALRELTDEGLVRRVAGVGTFVAEEKPQSGLLQVANLAEEIRARGHVHACDVILQAREAAPLGVAAALGLSTGDSVFHVVCIHRENGVPVQLEDRYVTPAVAPDFMTRDFTLQLPGEWLLEAVPLDEVEHVVDATGASAEEAAALDIQPGDPCLVLTRRTWSRSRAVTFVRCVHPGTRYRLGTRFKTSGGVMMG